MSPKKNVTEAEFQARQAEIEQIRAKKRAKVKAEIEVLQGELPERTLPARDFQSRVVGILADLAEIERL